MIEYIKFEVQYDTEIMKEVYKNLNKLDIECVRYIKKFYIYVPPLSSDQISNLLDYLLDTEYIREVWWC